MATNPVRSYFLYGIKDFFKEYDAQCEPEDKVDYKAYKEFIKDFFGEVMRRVIQDRMNFRIPYNLGYIGLHSKKPSVRNSPANWGKIIKGDTKAKHLNLHTFRRLYTVRWFKNNSSQFNNAPYYRFSMANSKYAKDRGLGGALLSKLMRDPDRQVM